MNDNLLAVIVSGYPICLLLGWLVGLVTGRTYTREPNRTAHWSDAPAIVIVLSGTVAVIVMLVSLVSGFIEGVK